MKIDSIKNGIVLDHIKAGNSMKIYNALGLSNMECTVAVLQRVPSKKMGKKDILKIADYFDIDFDDTEYTNPIQMYGTAVDGNDRDINIDVDEVVHEDFIGFGDHVFVAGLADEFKEEIGYNEAFFELDMTRANVMNSNLARMWFQVDWVVTDTDKNPAREDFENNKDYYYDLCSGTDLNAEEITVCKQFMNYVAKDQNDLQQKLDDINEQIAAAKKEISK